MESNAKKTVLNLGCGFKKFEGALNVDKFDNCKPDLVWDLEDTPWPFDSQTFDRVIAHHVLEHIFAWWDAFCEMARVTKPGGVVEVAVPHESSSTAGTWRDHYHIFDEVSFHGIQGVSHGTSAWGLAEQELVPLKLVAVDLVPFPRYMWMARWCPWVLRFCAKHLRNYIHEARYTFERAEDTKASPEHSRWAR